jgi:hypothetical protein
MGEVAESDRIWLRNWKFRRAESLKSHQLNNVPNVQVSDTTEVKCLFYSS